MANRHDLLLENAWAAFFSSARDWRRVRTLCEELLAESDLARDVEASGRRLYSQSLVGLSFQDKANEQPLRREAIEQAARALALYDENTAPMFLAEAHDTHGVALQLYANTFTVADQRIRLLREAVVALTAAVKVNPENEEAARHLVSAQEWLSDAERATQTGSEKPSGSGGSGCFVATATYGSATAAEVALFRRFRDGVLLRSGGGRLIVRLYYRVSPPLAVAIAKSRPLRLLTKVLVLDPIARILRERP